MAEHQGRDGPWFDEIYRRCYPAVMRYGYRRLYDLEAAHELAQDVFVVTWRRRRDVPTEVLPWLYAVARRLLANEWRARRTAAETVAPPPDHGWVAEPSDLIAAVMDVNTALATLSEADREVLRLIGWEELTVSEAATVLGCSRLAASARLWRARKRLTAALGSMSGDDSHVTHPRTGKVELHA